MTRASAIEVLQEDYVRTAYAKGQNELVILVRHVLANCAVPIVTVIGIGITLLIGGVVVTESVYNIPGLGRLVLDAVLARDYPKIGRAHVWTPVTNAPLVCRLLLEKNKTK